jgi:hypothetical protein
MRRLLKIADVMALAGTFLLFLVAMVVGIDVLARWIAAAPFPGRADIEKLLTAVAVAASFPLIVLAERNITMQAFAHRINRIAILRIVIVRILIPISIATFFGGTAWQILIYASRLFRSGETMPTIALASWPFWLIVGLSLLWTFLMAIALAIRPAIPSGQAESEPVSVAGTGRS